MTWKSVYVDGESINVIDQGIDPEDIDSVTVEMAEVESYDDDEAMAEPFAWLNSAGIHFDTSDDSVTVTISVGDPRGAFGMTIRRVPADADGEYAGKLLMHLPYARAGMLHMPLKGLHEGTFVVGP